MKESASSKNWKRRQVRDPFVKKAQKDNYRARSAYKLEEIANNYHIFKSVETVVDLGSAPGAWCQYIVKRSEQLHKKINVIAIDLLPMPAIANVNFMQGDFTNDEVKRTLQKKLEGYTLQLVLSDMAPNMSGLRAVDDARAMNLCESVAQFADDTLALGGNLVCKAFHGYYFEEFLANVKKNYTKTHCFKPRSSRPQSREVYIIGLGKT